MAHVQQGREGASAGASVKWAASAACGAVVVGSSSMRHTWRWCVRCERGAWWWVRAWRDTRGERRRERGSSAGGARGAQRHAACGKGQAAVGHQLASAPPSLQPLSRASAAFRFFGSGSLTSSAAVECPAA